MIQNQLLTVQVLARTEAVTGERAFENSRWAKRELIAPGQGIALTRPEVHYIGVAVGGHLQGFAFDKRTQ